MQSSKTNTRAFTLMELLVVVGIIALLVAILLPSLGRARYRAKITACMSNLRQVATATVAYASENSTAMPPCYGAGVGTAGNPSYPITTTAAWSYLFTADATSSSTDPGSNLGRLILTGFLGKANSLDDFYTWNQYRSQFPVRFCPGSDPRVNAPVWWTYGNSSYYLNPQWGWYYPPGSTTPKRVTEFRSLSDVPPTKTIAMDMIYDKPMSHTMGGTVTINLAYSDGHVESANDPGMLAALKSYPVADDPWRFDDFRDYVETIAAGRNPTQATAGDRPPTSSSPSTNYRRWRLQRNFTDYTGHRTVPTY